MNLRKKVTPQKTDELMKLFADMPSELIGDHLTDEEFIGYSMKTLTAQEIERVDAHLDSCPRCAIEMERLQEAAESWKQEELVVLSRVAPDQVGGELRITREQRAKLPKESLIRIAQVKGKQLASSWLEKLGGIPLAKDVALSGAGAKTRILTKGEAEGGQLRWRVEEDEQGNLTIHFASHAVGDLEGATLVIAIGEQ